MPYTTYSLMLDGYHVPCGPISLKVRAMTPKAAAREAMAPYRLSGQLCAVEVALEGGPRWYVALPGALDIYQSQKNPFREAPFKNPPFLYHVKVQGLYGNAKKTGESDVAAVSEKEALRRVRKLFGLDGVPCTAEAWVNRGHGWSDEGRAFRSGGQRHQFFRFDRTIEATHEA